jgi:hypothetical protein
VSSKFGINAEFVARAVVVDDVRFPNEAEAIHEMGGG